MRRRRLARAAVGTAVVAGTAGAVHHYQNKKYADDAAEDQTQYQDAYEQGAADAQAQQAAAPPPAPAPEEDLTAKLQELAQLHDSGALSDEEFASAKQKLLGS
jgi:hypothetical protein